MNNDRNTQMNRVCFEDYSRAPRAGEEGSDGEAGEEGTVDTDGAPGHDGGDPHTPGSAGAELRHRRNRMQSGVVRRIPLPASPQRPSWDEVDEYLHDGRHRQAVEHHATIDPDFADVLRWMRNDLEADACADDPATPPIRDRTAGR